MKILCFDMHIIAHQGAKAAFKFTEILHFYHYGYGCKKS